MKNTDTILLDIEGTVAPIEFVHKVLFPYSLEKMEQYLHQHAEKEEIISILLETKKIVQEETGFLIDSYEATQTLMNWVRDDRKAAPLKRLQGLIWQEGYESGELRSPLYPDVLPALRRWKAAGIRLAIYSSGSVQAQKSFFQYSTEGDLRDCFSAWFDTENAGPKREPSSYARIVRALGTEPEKIVFLSDVPAELDAARAVGLRVDHIVRPGTEASAQYEPVASFAALRNDE